MKNMQNMQKVFFKFSVITLIICLLFIINLTAYNFSGVITQYVCGFGFDYDSENSVAARQEGNELVTKIDEEGFVLLKNEENALPLEKTGDSIKVNVFGWSSSDKGFYHKGYGSGGGSNNGKISLYDGLALAGVDVNPDLANDYNKIKLKSGRFEGYTTDPQARYQVYEPGMKFLEDHLTNAKAYSDTALVVISRIGSEGTDLPKWQYSADTWEKLDNGRTYLQLSPDEEDMVNFCADNFDKTIVILNTSNVMECGFLANSKIDAALWVGLPGNAGTPVIGQVLSGEVNPSGKLVDTYPYDLTLDPTYVNAGADGIGKYARYGNTYIDYSEGIYTGYYWWETANKEGYFDELGGYNNVVQFPFGYGKSYTDFKWTLIDTNFENNAEIAEDAELVINVLVENVGKTYAGQDVVELYETSPYYLGEIEKPEVKLCAYAKTGILKPGEGQKLQLKVKIQDLASYDCYDSNYNGFMGYELDHGTYKLSLRTDAHNLKDMKNNQLLFKIPDKGYQYETDSTTGYKVENRFTNYTNTITNAKSVVDESKVTSLKCFSIDGIDCGQNIIYMSRSDFKGTFPIHDGNRSMSGDFVSNTVSFPKPVVDVNETRPITNSSETSYTLQDVAGLSYDDPKWDKLIEQLDIKTLASLSANGGYNTIAIESINKPFCVDQDGGSGIYPSITGVDGGKAVTYPCCTVLAATWNWYLAYQAGQSLAKEALAIGMNGWYAPGANMHRSPFGGRNFEYYSEDPFISGMTCAYHVKGAINGGVYAYIKHFVANDSDQGRNGEYRWLTEQALRELYCKPFEIAVKVGGANAIMSSVDRIGSTRCASSYSLLTEVLRNEWGFRGSVITDYYQGGNTHDADQNIRAGNDLQLLPGGKYNTMFDDYSSNTAVSCLQKSAKNILYTYINTQYIHANESQLDLTSVIGSRTSVFVWWVPVLISLDVAIVFGCGAWSFFIIKKSKKNGVLK